VTLRSPTLQVAIALVAGFVAGIVLRGTDIPRFIEPLGTVWINAIRMPVLPLIVMMLIASIAGSKDTRQIGTLGVRTLAVMIVLLSMFALIMTPLATVLLGG
jgi:proton glutamate symport protein